MAKYRVGTIAATYINLGEFEADSEEEAIEKAFEAQGTDTISLCYHCSRNVGELTLSSRDEDIEVEKIEEQEGESWED